MMNLPIYNQADPRWGAKVMAPSQLHLSRWGCLETCVSMMLANAAINLDPGQTCDRLVAAKAFMDTGDLSAFGIAQAFPGVYFHERAYTTITKDMPNTQKVDINVAVSRIKKLVGLGMPVPVNVDLIGGDGISDHWVLVVDTDFTIIDPAFGERVPFSKRYGKPETGIYGYFAFILSPISAPDGGNPALGTVAWKLENARRGINPNQNIKESIDLLID